VAVRSVDRENKFDKQFKVVYNRKRVWLDGFQKARTNFDHVLAC